MAPGILNWLRWWCCCRWVRFWWYSADRASYEITQLQNDPLAPVSISASQLTSGDTPVRVLDRIADLILMRPGIRVLDLGCGCGESLAYWALQYGIDGVGIEVVPVRASCGNRLAAILGISMVVVESDCRVTQWPEFNVLYCVATCFDPALIGAISRQLSQLPSGTVVVVIGMELPAGYKQIHQERVRFPWGYPELRIGRRVSAQSAGTPI